MASMAPGSYPPVADGSSSLLSGTKGDCCKDNPFFIEMALYGTGFISAVGGRQFKSALQYQRAIVIKAIALFIERLCIISLSD
jgi:hypothetical protein